MLIIVKGKQKRRPRSEWEKILRKEGWGGSMNEEKADKCEFLERKAKEELGSNAPVFFKQHHIDTVDEGKK